MANTCCRRSTKRATTAIGPKSMQSVLRLARAVTAWSEKMKATDEPTPTFLTRLGSAVDRATLRLLSRAFAGDDRPGRAARRGAAELLEIGRRFYSSAE